MSLVSGLFGSPLPLARGGPRPYGRPLSPLCYGSVGWRRIFGAIKGAVGVKEASIRDLG